MRSDRGCDRPSGLGDILRSLARGDVLEHYPQVWEAPAKRLEHGVDEHRLAIEHVNLRVGDFAVHQKGHAARLHRFQRVVGVREIGDPGIRMGGGAGRIKLDRVNDTALRRPPDLVGVGAIGEIKRHERREIGALR